MDETLAGLAENVVQPVMIDYTAYLEALIQYSNWITSFLLFFVIVVLCWGAYKFFRIFF